MSDLRVDTITDSAGTGAPDFSNGATFKGVTLNELDSSTPASNVTLTFDDEQIQVISPSTDIDINLPTTNVVKGQSFILLVNLSEGDQATLKSSDGDTIEVLGSTGSGSASSRSKVVAYALQDTPTDATHWYVYVDESGRYTPSTGTFANLDSATPRSFSYIRSGNVVSISGNISVDPTSNATPSGYFFTVPILMKTAPSADFVGGGGVSTRFHNSTSALDQGSIRMISGNNAEMGVIFFSDGTAADDHNIVAQYSLS